MSEGNERLGAENISPFPGGVDPQAIAFLGALPWEELPGGRDFVVACSAWRHTITSEGVTPDLMADIHGGFTQHETAQPDSPVWDRLRAYLADNLFVEGHNEASVDLLYGMHSFHGMVQMARRFGAIADEEAAGRLVQGLMSRFAAEPDNARLMQFDQALYVAILRDDPTSPQLDLLEAELSRNNQDYDPVDAWANSQQELRIGLVASGVAAYVRDDDRWAAVPVRQRLHLMATHLEMLALARRPGSEELEQYLSRLEAFLVTHPEAAAVDELRLGMGVELARLQREQLAVTYARSIRNPGLQQDMTVILLDSGFEQSAFDFADAIPDPTIRAQTLSRAQWTEGRGFDRLFEIVNSTDFPHGLRIACAEELREQVRLVGGDTSRYDAVITLLRAEQDLESGSNT